MIDDLKSALLHRRETTRKIVSADEWAAREDLAACYRLCAHYGMTDMIFNHISLRVPGTHDQFLINPFGLLYEEVSASNLVKIGLNGEILDDGLFQVIKAGFVIHAAIHKARPDIDCVLHTHTRAGISISARAEGLLPISQPAMRFYERIGYHAYEGIALNLDEQVRLVQDLGPHKAMILRNHGLLTVGASVREAFIEMYYLEIACQVQLDANAGGSTLVFPATEVCELASEQFARSNPFIQGRDWRALRRMLDKNDPSYKL